ncbi:MAG: GNAT family N-acetyltransferase [Anaerolineae bacterium]|nr:GNAT family N-acetyltransferase [Anaerolineae bacterium]
MSAFLIEPMQASDWDAVREIYLAGIATGNATFETTAPEWAEWDAKHRSDCRLVARANGGVIGWTALSPVSARKVYAGVVEESVYIAASAQGKGVGKALLSAVIAESEKVGIWTIQTSIFPENVGSLALHKSCGFREVGYREHIGQMNGVWRNTIFLERRSRMTGM